ncbi:hypothetical protein [Streptomyces yunnanensis]
MLAEARGYRLSMLLAHQHLAQLPRDLREGISANARNKIFFNASPEDAGTLERHTLPTLAAHDLAHLGPYQAAAHLLTGGAENAAFTLTTRPRSPAVPQTSARQPPVATAPARPLAPERPSLDHVLGGDVPCLPSLALPPVPAPATPPAPPPPDPAPTTTARMSRPCPASSPTVTSGWSACSTSTVS